MPVPTDCISKTGAQPIEAVRLTVREFFKAFPTIMEGLIIERKPEQGVLDRYARVMIAEGGNPDVIYIAVNKDGMPYVIARQNWLLAAKEVLDRHGEYVDKTYVRAVVVRGLSEEDIMKLFDLVNQGSLNPSTIFARAFTSGILIPLARCLARSLTEEEVKALASDVGAGIVKSEVTRQVIGLIEAYARVIDPEVTEKDLLTYVYMLFKVSRARDEIRKVNPRFLEIADETLTQASKEAEETEEQQQQQPTPEPTTEPSETEEEEESEVEEETAVENEEAEVEEEVEEETTRPKPRQLPPPPVPAETVSVRGREVPTQSVVTAQLITRVGFDGGKIIISDDDFIASMKLTAELASSMPWGRHVKPEVLVQGVANAFKALGDALRYGMTYGKPGSAQVLDTCREAVITLSNIGLINTPGAALAQVVNSKVLVKLDECLSTYRKFAFR